MAKTAKMPKTIPAFQTEDEEIEFWDTHNPDDYFEETPLDDIIVAIKPEPKKAVTLRLDPVLLARLKEVAAQHHMGYQTLARELLRHALSVPPVAARAAAQAKPASVKKPKSA
ncbi:MAG TPA: CopG family antitoxin [Armatimonadota bacterium]